MIPRDKLEGIHMPSALCRGCCPLSLEADGYFASGSFSFSGSGWGSGKFNQLRHRVS